MIFKHPHRPQTVEKSAFYGFDPSLYSLLWGKTGRKPATGWRFFPLNVPE